MLVTQGPTLPTWAVKQFGSYLGYSGRASNVVAKAAWSPRFTCRDEAIYLLSRAQQDTVCKRFCHQRRWGDLGAIGLTEVGCKRRKTIAASADKSSAPIKIAWRLILCCCYLMHPPSLKRRPIRRHSLHYPYPLSFTLAMFEDAYAYRIDVYQAMVGGRGGPVALAEMRRVLSDFVQCVLSRRRSSARIDASIRRWGFLTVLGRCLEKNPKMTPMPAAAMSSHLVIQGSVRC
jgi:hypothetical protein